VDKQGCLTLVLQVAETPELVGWILSFGAGVRVLRPDSLRRQVQAIAAEIARDSTSENVARHSSDVAPSG
jgi:predicted DNA-binding transcriptional regulator YafY